MQHAVECRRPYHRPTDESGDVPAFTRALSEGDWRLLPTVANRMPTAASYLRAPGDSVHRAFKLDVLRIVDGRIAEITTFGYALFPQFGLPETLEAKGPHRRLAPPRRAADGRAFTW